jgi:beta-alanine degradation protein BauB
MSPEKSFSATALSPRQAVCYHPPPEEEMKAFLSRAAVLAAILFGAMMVMHSQQSAVQTQRIPQFENDDVKVWKSVVLPNAPLTMHRHEHPRVIIALQGGTMKIVEQNGPTEQHVWETGRAYWLPANPPNTLHADVNASDKAIEVMVVELKHEN